MNNKFFKFKEFYYKKAFYIWLFINILSFCTLINVYRSKLKHETAVSKAEILIKDSEKIHAQLLILEKMYNTKIDSLKDIK